jgi:hypothetical protein
LTESREKINKELLSKQKSKRWQQKEKPRDKLKNRKRLNWRVQLYLLLNLLQQQRSKLRGKNKLRENVNKL